MRRGQLSDIIALDADFQIVSSEKFQKNSKMGGVVAFLKKM